MMEKKIRVILEDIWSGKTELKWEQDIYLKGNICAKFQHNGIPFEFYYHDETRLLCVYDCENRDANVGFKNQRIQFQTQAKKYAQDWYNKFLLEQASK